MTTNVWNELALGAPEWLARPVPVEAPDGAAARRQWPPVLMRDYLNWTPSRAVTVSPETRLGQVIDFLALRPDNVVAVADGGNVLGALFEDWAVAAIREAGMQALDLPVADIMEAAPWCCDVSDSPYVVIAACEARQVRRAPVMMHGRIAAAADLAGLRRFLSAAG